MLYFMHWDVGFLLQLLITMSLIPGLEMGRDEKTHTSSFSTWVYWTLREGFEQLWFLDSDLLPSTHLALHFQQSSSINHPLSFLVFLISSLVSFFCMILY